MLFNGPKSLIDAISSIIKEDRQKYSDEQAEMNKLVAEKLTPKQKKHIDKNNNDKIDAHDFHLLRKEKMKEEVQLAEDDYKKGDRVKCMKSGMSGTVMGVDTEKEEDENEKYYTVKLDSGKMMKYEPDELKPLKEAAQGASKKKEDKFHNMLDKLVHKTFGHSSDEKKMKKEEVEQIDELKKTTMLSYIGKASGQAADKAFQGGMAGARGDTAGQKAAMSKEMKRRTGIIRAAGRLATGRTTKEEKDTPGNGYEHQCAIHVKSEQFGEGKTLFSQHAEPDVNGNIGWYDVMFEHGIERVETKDLEILVSESHGNHKKKRGM